MPEFSLLQKIVIWVVPVIFAITVHEVAHGWVADKLGDHTARLLGRLTLNPMKHIDLIGTVLVPLFMILTTGFAFGWAKPVPIDWRNLRHPKRDMALVAAAGPGANLFMFALWVMIAKAALIAEGSVGATAAPVYYMSLAGISVNALFMVLNLLPVPPLDGSRVLSAVLPPRWAWRLGQLERYGLLIVVLLLVTGLLGKILTPPLQALQALASLFLR